MSTTPATTTTTPHITDVRSILMDQLKALRAAKGSDVEQEIRRSKAVSDLSQTAINSAKIEIDYLSLTGQEKSDFLEIPAPIFTSTPSAADAPSGVTRNSADVVKKTINPWERLLKK